MEMLSYIESVSINGGHNGPAYKAGKAVGEFLGDVEDVVAAYALYMTFVA